MYCRRLGGVDVKPTEKALEALFVETFDQARQGRPGGLDLWAKTSKGVLDDLIAFVSGRNYVTEWGQQMRFEGWYLQKKQQYSVKPPVPPRPKVLHLEHI